MHGKQLAEWWVVPPGQRQILEDDPAPVPTTLVQQPILHGTMSPGVATLVPS
jgi:hypothetical protein